LQKESGDYTSAARRARVSLKPQVGHLIMVLNPAIIPIQRKSNFHPLGASPLLREVILSLDLAPLSRNEPVV
jgi:hypothetical protein